MLLQETTLVPLELKAAIVRDPLVVSPDTPVMDAIVQMSGVRSQCATARNPGGYLDELHLEARSSCVIVVDGERLIGILTERDVVRLSAQQQPCHQIVVEQVMTHPVVTLRESAFTDLFSVVNLLHQHRIRHLPILNEQDQLVGLLTHESLRQISRPIDLLRLRRVSEVMNSEVVCAAPDCSVLAIARQMADHCIGSVMIVKSAEDAPESLKTPIGILTERDLVQFQALGLSLEDCKAETIMSAPVFAVKLDESLWAVQQMMEQRLIRRLAVTGERGELLGIVTQTSLLQALNPLELYKLAEVLEARVVCLEAEKVALLKSRTTELEHQVEARTAALKTQAEREKLLAEIASQIRSSLNLQAILDTTVEKVRQVLGCDRVNIWRFETDGQTVAVAESTDSPLSLVGEWVKDACFQRDYTQIYTQGHVRVVADIYTTEMTDCHREMLIRLQTRAKILLPLLCGDRLWGLLSATESQHPRNWKSEEIELLQTLSVQLAIALQQATTHQQLQEELNTRQQTEVRLRESERRYVTLVEAAPVGIFHTDDLGDCIYVNERWCQIAGLLPEAALGKGWQQAVHPDDRHRVAQEWQQSVQENRPFQLEYRFQNPNGAVRWVYGQSVAEQNGEGRTIGYVGTITDISDRKQAERQLQNLIEGTATTLGQDFFPALVTHIAETLNVPYVVVTEKTEDRLCALAFWSNGTLQPLFSYDLMKTPCEQTLQNGVYHCECLVQQRFPEDLDLAKMGVESYLGVALYDTQGKAIGNLCILSYQPIHDPQRAESLLRVFAARAAAELQRERATHALEQLNQELENRVTERTLALQASEERWQLALRGSKDGIWDWDVTTNQVFFSGRWKSMRGFAEDEVSDRLEEWIERIHPDDYNRVRVALSEHFAGKLEFFELEYRVRCKDDSYLWVLDRGQALRDDSGEVTRMSGSETDITRRKLAEAERDRLLSFLEASLNEIYVFDAVSLRFVYANQGAVNNLGYSLEALKTMTPLDLKPDYTEAEFRQLLQPLLQGTQHILKLETHHKRADGSFYPTEVHLQPHEYLGERFFLAVIVDVTERHQAEVALRESQHFIQQIAEASPNILYLYDVQEQRNVYANREIATVLGYTPAEIQAMGSAFLQNLIHPDDALRVPAQLERINLAQDGEILEFEYRMRHVSGEWRWLYSRDVVFSRDGNGRVKQTIGTAQDITDRKHAEQTIQQQAGREKLLREITQRIRQSLDLHTIFDTACHEIRQFLQADRVGIFKFYRDSGFDDGEFVAESVAPAVMPLFSVRVYDHCFGDRFAALYQQGRVQATSDVETAGLEECHRAVLSRFQVRANLILPLLKGRELWGLLCVHQCSGPRQWQPMEVDLTHEIATQLAIAIQQASLFEQLQQELKERQQAQHQLTERNQQLAISNEELARATRLKDEFLANMSHELRTPLNAILGMTEGLQDQVFGGINDRQLKALQTIERSGSHLLELINDILDVAKIESGQMDLDRVSTAVAPLCQSSLAFIKQQALKKRIQLDIKLPPDLPGLVIDERRIRQVLINLLNNAVKFTPEGGKVTLEVMFPIPDAGREGFLRIAVIDTGIGIAPEDISKLFKPFIQIDSALNRQYNGTGLGLALVKRIVELHGGEVGVTSQPGAGSCFTVDLPWGDATSCCSEPEALVDDGSEPGNWSKAGPLILLAEDNEANVETIARYLETQGYGILLASNGQEAIALAQSNHPDLILMDIQMPGMDGLEAMEQIRRDPTLGEVPIVALTALAMTGDRDRCLAAGANDYLSKPVRLKHLAATIQHLLNP